MRKISLLFTVSLLYMSCGNTGKQEQEDSRKNLNFREKIRLRQYQVQGAKIYANYCANCHQKDGKGIVALYPPLDGSDYLLGDLARAACIIKNGQSKEIVVNGITYNQMMPGNPITNLEIAEVLTFISNAWGNETGLISVKELDKWLKDCEEEY